MTQSEERRGESYIMHELLANGANLLGEGGGEHLDLLVVWGGTEDVLDVFPHVKLLEDVVALVNNEVLEALEVEVSLIDELEDAAGGTDEDVGRALLQDSDILLLGLATAEVLNLHAGQVLGEALVLLHDLEGELAGVTEDEDQDLALLRGVDVELLEGGDDEDGGLTHTALGLAEHVVSEDGLRDTLLLDC